MPPTKQQETLPCFASPPAPQPPTGNREGLPEENPAVPLHDATCNFNAPSSLSAGKEELHSCLTLPRGLTRMHTRRTLFANAVQSAGNAGQRDQGVFKNTPWTRWKRTKLLPASQCHSVTLSSSHG
uniref:Uncharacterized protein n=1 Tax=Eutreptiella gymnastica TaxID=73025 RepID=A0A7S4FSJ9_9EUGL|mmetsp:Transcript_46549/g.78137  ORF Transcript_46549/g.78137 Transcript_46549/m.78137 type:complete len:126 (+) Transcript_46549:21-398(+)